MLRPGDGPSTARRSRAACLYSVSCGPTILPPLPTPCARFQPFAGNWAWAYITAVTIRQGRESRHGRESPQNQISFNWTGPYKSLVVEPCSSGDIPNGSPLGGKRLCCYVPPSMRGADVDHPVSVALCKPCANPPDCNDIVEIFTGGAGANRDQQLHQETPCVSRHYGRRFGAPVTSLFWYLLSPVAAL